MFKLDKIITLERRGNEQDATGQKRESWKAFGRAWARIRPVSSRAFFAASGERAEVTHEIVLRFSLGQELKAGDRIIHKGRVFDVIAPFNIDERNRYLRAMSVEHAN